MIPRRVRLTAFTVLLALFADLSAHACVPARYDRKWNISVEQRPPFLSSSTRLEIEEIARAARVLQPAHFSVESSPDIKGAVEEAVSLLQEKGLGKTAVRNAGIGMRGFETILQLRMSGTPPSSEVDLDAGHPIYDAIKAGNFDALSAAVKRYGYGFQSFSGKTPLYWAVSEGNYLFVHYLIAQGALFSYIANSYIERSDLYNSRSLAARAAHNGNLPMLRLLERGGLDIKEEASQALYAATCGDRHLLTWLPVSRGNASVIEYLLNHGADPNDGPEKGKKAYSTSPIYCAIERQDIGLIDGLLQGGAQINAVSPHGNTPAFAVSRNLPLLKHLVARGASLRHVGWANATLLHYPQKLDEETIGYLISAGLDIEGRSYMGRTPLHWAAGQGDLSVFRTLVSHGVHIDATDDEGHTAIDIAAASNQLEVVRELLGLGQSPKASKKNGQTALHKAAMAGPIPSSCGLGMSDAQIQSFTRAKEVLVKTLLNAGYDPAAKDNQGQSAYQYMHRYFVSDELKKLLQN